MIERTINTIENIPLAGIDVVIGSTGPDEPLHALGGDRRRARISPEEGIVVILEVQVHGHGTLPQLRKTLGGLRPGFRFGKCRQQHGRENGNNGYYHQQFDEREGGCCHVARRRNGQKSA